MDDTRRRSAGEFSAWLRSAHVAIRDGASSDVPCDGCTACCSSSQFVHIEPDERDALAHIPDELLFPAPGRPAGHVLMGYDEHGRCPMLVDGACSIYEHRPRTCRTYDCRVFPAAGVKPRNGPGEGAGSGAARLAERVAEWEFAYADDRARAEHDAVRAAAAYLDRRRADFPAGAVPANPTQLAVLAVEAHAPFLTDPDPAPAAVRVAIHHHRRPHAP